MDKCLRELLGSTKNERIERFCWWLGDQTKLSSKSNATLEARISLIRPSCFVTTFSNARHAQRHASALRYTRPRRLHNANARTFGVVCMRRMSNICATRETESSILFTFPDMSYFTKFPFETYQQAFDVLSSTYYS